jgi:hypothetical protein
MSEVEITLNGKTETLRCTLRAAKRVNAGGGFAEMLRKLAIFDQDTYFAIVAAGLDKKTSDVEDAVYENGLPDLTESLSTYVSLLANGGKPLKTTETGGTGEA